MKIIIVLIRLRFMMHALRYVDVAKMVNECRKLTWATVINFVSKIKTTTTKTCYERH